MLGMNTSMLSVRLDVLSVALQEVCGALAPAQAAQVAAGLRSRLGGQSAHVGPDADESVAAELAGLLAALGQLQSVQATTLAD